MGGGEGVEERMGGWVGGGGGWRNNGWGVEETMKSKLLIIFC